MTGGHRNTGVVEGGWLALLPDPARRRVLGRCVPVRAERGRVLYHLGDAPDGLYAIVSGCIRMETSQSGHGPTMLSLFHAGAWLGEVELFSGMPRLTTLTVLRPAEYLFLPRAALDALAEENPDIWRCLGHLAAEHVALAVAGLDDMTIRNSSARLAAVILRLAGARLDGDPCSGVTELDVTQAELAEMSNLSRSMAAELLVELERQGLVARHYGGLGIRDLAGLRRMMLADTPDAA